MLWEVLYDGKIFPATLIYTVHEKMININSLIQRKYDPKLLFTLFGPYSSEIETNSPMKHWRMMKASEKQAYTFSCSSALWNKCKLFLRLYLKESSHVEDYMNIKLSELRFRICT